MWSFYYVCPFSPLFSFSRFTFMLLLFSSHVDSSRRLSSFFALWFYKSFWRLFFLKIWIASRVIPLLDGFETAPFPSDIMMNLLTCTDMQVTWFLSFQYKKKQPNKWITYCTNKSVGEKEKRDHYRLFASVIAQAHTTRPTLLKSNSWEPLKDGHSKASNGLQNHESAQRTKLGEYVRSRGQNSFVVLLLIV